VQGFHRLTNAGEFIPQGVKSAGGGIAKILVGLVYVIGHIVSP
jgi:hypothetical protein